MPAALVPIIATVVAAAATTATSIYGAVNQPGTPKAPAPAGPTGPTSDQIKAAVGPQALSIESATGGSVSPDYLSTIAPILAGVPTSGQGSQNAINSVIQGILGNQQIPSFGGGAGGGFGAGLGSTPAPFTPSGMPVNLGALSATPGTSDFLTKIAGGIG